MRLREFDLDAPEESRERRSQFRLQTRCVTSLFERHFNGALKTPKYWKILVEVVPKITNDKAIDLLGVLAIQTEFDLSIFFGATNSKRKRLALALLTAGVAKVIEEMNWPKEPFDNATNKVVEMDFVNCWTWKKRARSPKRDLVAEVYCCHDVEEFVAFLRVRDTKGRLVKEKKILTDTPSEFIFAKHFGELKWLDDRTVQLFPKFGRGKYSVTVS